MQYDFQSTMGVSSGQYFVTMDHFGRALCFDRETQMRVCEIFERPDRTLMIERYLFDFEGRVLLFEIDMRKLSRMFYSLRVLNVAARRWS